MIAAGSPGPGRVNPPLAWTTVTASAGVAALAVACGGWFLGQAGWAVRVLAGCAGLALLYADPAADVIGAVIAGLAIVLQVMGKRQGEGAS